MRGLFSNIVAFRIVWIVPPAGVCFAENWVKRLLYTAVLMLAAGCKYRQKGLRRFYMPSAEVEFRDSYKASDGIFNIGYRQQMLRMCHEATLWLA